MGAHVISIFASDVYHGFNGKSKKEARDTWDACTTTLIMTVTIICNIKTALASSTRIADDKWILEMTPSYAASDSFKTFTMIMNMILFQTVIADHMMKNRKFRIIIYPLLVVISSFTMVQGIADHPNVVFTMWKYWSVVGYCGWCILGQEPWIQDYVSGKTHCFVNCCFMSLNIFECVVVDTYTGYHLNALTGVLLIASLPWENASRWGDGGEFFAWPPTGHHTSITTLAWVLSYIPWNNAFMLGLFRGKTFMRMWPQTFSTFALTHCQDISQWSHMRLYVLFLFMVGGILFKHVEYENAYPDNFHRLDEKFPFIYDVVCYIGFTFGLMAFVNTRIAPKNYTLGHSNFGKVNVAKEITKRGCDGNTCES